MPPSAGEHREVKSLIQGHTARRQRSQYLNPGCNRQGGKRELGSPTKGSPRAVPGLRASCPLVCEVCSAAWQPVRMCPVPTPRPGFYGSHSRVIFWQHSGGTVPWWRAQKPQPDPGLWQYQLCDFEQVPFLLWTSVPDLEKGGGEEPVRVGDNTPRLSHRDNTSLPPGG